jgi:hypothetical protein
LDAYVRTEAEPDIKAATIEYIEHYVPEHSGENCIAHITVGLAKLDDLTAMEAENFEPLTFSPAGFERLLAGQQRHRRQTPQELEPLRTTARAAKISPAALLAEPSMDPRH